MSCDALVVISIYKNKNNITTYHIVDTAGMGVTRDVLYHQGVTKDEDYRLT